MNFAKEPERKVKTFLIRFTATEMDDLRQLADLHANGNVSQLIRQSIDHFANSKPPLSPRKTKGRKP